jgi:hypothetical protein
MHRGGFHHLFEQFVSKFGGEVLPEVHVVRYADFLFRPDHVVAELKTLEEDKEAEHNRRLLELSYEWSRRGLLHIIGTTNISLLKLPPPCQRDWLNVLQPPVENLIRDANRQIRSTKEYLKLENFKGLLLIVNEGNFLHTDPVNYMILVSRVLNKRKDGRARFPHIDGVVYFSHRVGSKDEGIPFWAPGTAAVDDPMMKKFLEKLRSGWMSYLSEVTGQHIVEIPKGELAHLGLEVEGYMNGNEHVAWTRRVYCKKDNCGKDIQLISDSLETPQYVQCPAHGVLTSFQNYDEYERTLKFVVNQVAESKGLPKIASDVKGQPFTL